MLMNSLILLQTSSRVLEKSAQMIEKDPHGAIITLVSVCVVFSALIILYFAYTMIGKAASGNIDFSKIFACKRRTKPVKGPSDEEAAAIALALDQEFNGEVYAAIGLAIHQHMNNTVHDLESYIITIRRK